MDLEALYQKLIAAARIHRPAATVPYGFERRVVARLASQAQAGLVMVWERLLWRAAAGAIAVALVVSAISLLDLADNGASLASLAYGQDFESTVLVAADVLSDSW